MNKIDQDQLEAFVIEAQLINQKVKALAQNRMTTEEFDKLTQKRIQDKQNREQAKIKKQKQAVEKIRKGRDGKGISKNFKNFCRFCHKEYELETVKCLKCDRPTMTLQQRQQQLQVMVEEYKFNKKQRSQKRQKWQMFQKTQAAMWKKSSINYNKKWEYFVQQSDQQQQQEPILPKDDPNFKALEMDMEQRKQRRAKDNQNAKNLKQKGNDSMKKGDYQKAMQYYTLALQHIKDIKSIYTNRALAFIKLKKYKKAIQDCTNVIEYMQVFQKIGQNQDITFKAFSRRALAKKQIKQYKSALQDINHALKLIPNDKNAILLKTEIEGFIKHTQTVQKLIKQSKQQQKINQQQQQKLQQVKQQEEQEEYTEQKSKDIQKQIIKQLAQNQLKQQTKQQLKKNHQSPKVQKQIIKHENPVKQIPQRLSKLNQENIQYLLNLLFKNKELKSLFISAKGIQKVLDYLFQTQSTKNEALLIIYCIDKDGVAEKRINDWGIFKFYQKILSKFADQTKLKQQIYAFIDNLFEILVPMTLYEPCRLQLSSSQASFAFIFKLFPRLITKYSRQPNLVDNFFIFMSNLCSGQSQLKTKYLKKQNFLSITKALFQMILQQKKSKNRKVLDVKQSIYSLIANIITHLQHRKIFVEYLIKEDKMIFLKSQIQSYPRYAHNFDPYIENMLSLFVNATLQTSIEHMELSDSIFDRFVVNWQKYSEIIVYRSLLVLSRFKYSTNKNLTKWMKVFNIIAQKSKPLANPQQKNMIQIIKILNVLFSADKPQTIVDIPNHLFQSLVIFVKDNLVNQNLFCNTCNLFGILIDKKDHLSIKIYEVLRSTIEKLVDIAKEKTGNWRKSASILIAKSSGDEKCRQEITRTHGMQVLKSVAPFIINQK